MPIPSVRFLASGCTRSLDATLVELRARYAAERDDFHEHFCGMTLADIQRELRTRRRDEGPDEHWSLVFQLLFLQREQAHPLFAHLLVQAFEATLVRRRRAISLEEDAALDDLVLETFLGALENLPYAHYDEDLQAHVMATSRAALAKRLGRRRLAPLASPPPTSSVACTAEVSVGDLGDTSTEVA